LGRKRQGRNHKRKGSFWDAALKGNREELQFRRGKRKGGIGQKGGMALKKKKRSE